jgi:hypothetical protein
MCGIEVIGPHITDDMVVSITITDGMDRTAIVAITGRIGVEAIMVEDIMVAITEVVVGMVADTGADAGKQQCYSKIYSFC